MEKQLTLKDCFTLRSKGLHTGKVITARFCPAPENYGYRIVRVDLEGQPVIECKSENVVETTRGTVVAAGDVKVSTIEHAMAALYASGVDNCRIELDGPEMPILDGSAELFIEQIQKVGLADQDAEKRYFSIDKELVIDGERGEHIVVSPCDHLSFDITIAFQSKMLENQSASLDDINDFKTEIASARTFVFVRDIQPLFELGYIKGGDLDNAIVIYENELPQDKLDSIADEMGVPHMDATKLGYLNRKPLTWPNEMARHKLLDIIGDLALIGMPLKAKVTALRPGHTINNKVARAIKAESDK